MIGFGLVVAALVLLALTFVLFPLLRGGGDRGPSLQTSIVLGLAFIATAIVLQISVNTYDPELPKWHGTAAERAILDRQREDLQQNPDDPAGWERLGEIYRDFGDYRHASSAFLQAYQRSPNPSDRLMLALAEAQLVSNPASANGLPAALIDDVLRRAPGNQAALWLGAIVAIELDDRALALSRLVALHDSGPPPEIADIIQRQIIALAAAPGEGAIETAADPSGAVIHLDVSVADSISLEALGPQARLFLIARAPDSPAPIAVLPLSPDSLPGRFSLSDADAMLPGRHLSQYEVVTVVARVSATGVTEERPGDVYAEASVRTDRTEPVKLLIDRVVGQD